MVSTDNPQLQTMINNMPEKTGRALEEWFVEIQVKDLEKHSEIMKLLKGEYGVSHGFANTISSMYRNQKEDGGKSGQDLISAQYSKKLHMKPWYEQLISQIKQFGDDVEISPKKNYVSLRRAKQFGIIQPSTQKRMDLGINLKGAGADGVLIEGDKWSGMCSHRMELHNQDDITDAVIDWFHQAYLAAG